MYAWLVALRHDQPVARSGHDTRAWLRLAQDGSRFGSADSPFKVKANIFKEPDLKSMAIHVKTENSVVMLSGFVDSKAEADKAVTVARSVDGVTSVTSAIKVK